MLFVSDPLQTLFGAKQVFSSRMTHLLFVLSIINVRYCPSFLS